MTNTELAGVLLQLGCPQEKVAEMAGMLVKRARQLAAETGRRDEEAMAHLLSLMRRGWAAKEKGF